MTAASSGEQAWQTFVATRPDVVLLDLVLRDITGIDVLRRIRQLSPETKVTDQRPRNAGTNVEAMKLGGYDFIRKPFELEEIVTTVRNAARDQRAGRGESRLPGASDPAASGFGRILYASTQMANKLRGN